MFPAKLKSRPLWQRLGWCNWVSRLLHATDHQQLCIVAAGMDLPKMPWLRASSAVWGEKELPAHGSLWEMCVPVCWGALLWVRQPVRGPTLSRPALPAHWGRRVGTALGTTLPGPGCWPRDAGADGRSGVCQGTVAALSRQDIAKPKDSLGVWPHLDGELNGGLKTCVLAF